MLLCAGKSVHTLSPPQIFHDDDFHRIIHRRIQPVHRQCAAPVDQDDQLSRQGAVHNQWRKIRILRLDELTDRRSESAWISS